MANQSFSVEIRILQGSSTGTQVCDETFATTTNDFGLINLQIGSQNPTSFAAIDWANGPYWIEVSLDGTLFGTSQLVSVPFALHAATADSLTGFSETDPVFNASIAAGITGTDTAYWNDKLDVELDGSNTNELQVLSISNDTIYLSDGGFAKLPASFDGDYNSLTNKPDFTNWDTDVTDDFDGDYSSLTNAPTNVSAFTNDAGYLTSFTEAQILSISNDTIYLTGGSYVKLPAGFDGDYNSLSNKPDFTNWDTDVTDDFDGDYSSLTNAPTNVSTFSNDAGYLTSFTEAQILTISNDTIYLTGGSFVKLPAGFDGDYNSLSNKPDFANWDTDVTDDFDGDYSSLTNAPTNVSTFSNDAGYLTSFTEVDGSITNELQILSISNDTIYLSDGGFAKLPAGFDGDYNSLSNKPDFTGWDTNAGDDFDGQYSSLIGTPTNVSSFTNDAGYLTFFTEVDGSITNELQILSISNDTIYLTNGGFAKLPAGFDGDYNSLTNKPDFTNWDTDVTDDFDGDYNNLSNTPTNVSTFTNDAGYLTSEVDGDNSNELQTISISGHDISLSNGGGTITVPDNNTTYNPGNQLTLTGSTFNVTEGSGSGLDADLLDGVHYSDIQSWVNANDDNTTYFAGTGLSLSGTTFNINFGTIAGTVSEGNHTHTNMVTGTGEINHLAFWTGSSTISYDNSKLYYNPSGNSLFLGASSGPGQFNMYGDASINLQNSNSITVSGTQMGYIGFTDNHSSSPTARIVAYRGNTGGTGDLPTDIVFETVADGSTTLTERMRINHNGNVGIGLSDPYYPFQVKNTSKVRTVLIEHNTTAFPVTPQYGFTLNMDVNAPNPVGIESDVETNYVYAGFISNTYAFKGRADTRNSTGPFDKAAGAYFEGWANYVSYGVLAHSYGTQNSYGIYATAQSGTSSRYGVCGYADATATNSYAVYAMGNFSASGTKAATVKTENGPKELYCQESPEIWFEDFGSASVSNGQAIVDLQNDFVSTVTINDQYPIKVFITPNSDLGNWWVEKKGTTFILHAPNAANGSEFDYRVVAKRQGYEDYRMNDAPAAYSDYNLYQNIEDVPEEYRENWVNNAPIEIRKNYPEYYDGSNDLE
ncbi:MAG: hypothetical protein C0592_14635 [Marinilabiliales bacterium]|nr:MAG: hypothetical protein C0592_14635 [Marinilabiliales bacterium]